MVESAIQELRDDGATLSASRISAATGVHRKDVSKLLAAKPLKHREKNLVSRVIGQWQADRRFCSAPGKARALGVEGKRSEFAQLVSTVSADLNPYTVLYEMERLDLVSRHGAVIKLTKGLFLPRGDIKQSFALLGRDVEDLCEAVQENVFNNPAVPNHHIQTEYDNIPLERVPQIKQWLFNEGAKWHRKLRSYLSQLDRDLTPAQSTGPGRARVVLGSFSRIEDVSLALKRERR